MIKPVNASTPIRVMIIDDHEIVRRGLGAMLSAFDDLALAGEAESCEQALQLLSEQQPDVILMDLVMPEVDGAVATRLIKAAYPSIQVIALTSFKEQDLVHAALQAGAVGYLLKNIPASELADAIRSAHRGQMTLAPEVSRQLIESSRNTIKQDALTRRELEVLKWMVEGASNAEIAGHLFVSRSTVKYYVSSILSKLGASSRTEAVSIAIKGHMV
jgi:two-component system, NarL family, response regulator LiaR